MKKLYRSKTNRMVSGVCAGIAEYLGIDPTVVRIIFAILILTGGLGLFAYVICLLLMPEAPESF